MVNLLYFNDKLSDELLNLFVDKELIYGDGQNYGAFISPSVTIFNQGLVDRINADLEEIWKLYEILNELYIKSIDGDAPSWIHLSVECGLTNDEIKIQRLIAKEKLQPKFCRLDYIELEPQRKIAEVQWKSGGLGLFSGIQNIYSRVVSLPNAYREKKIVNGIHRLISASIPSSSNVTINCVRLPWMSSENYLRDILLPSSEYFPISLKNLYLNVGKYDGKYYLTQNGKKYEIGFGYGLGYWTRFADNLYEFATDILDGKLWIESPLNSLYRQKWGLAMPFMPSYKNLFSERLREIIPPSVLLHGNNVNFDPILEYSPKFTVLESVTRVSQLADLPLSIRKSMILKCGGGIELNSRGKGVFRLGSTRKKDKEVLAFVQNRIARLNEPWIVQEYIKSKTDIFLSMPNLPLKFKELSTHTRFMLFGINEGRGQVEFVGGLGNYGIHWKVAGRHPKSSDETGKLVTGSSFNDIRIL